eukprot:Sspe_Gene.88024::Locus_60160_Transcript_1_1_Confidence_1.000_Length_1323::g.88024::m.88024/K13513/LCLAT1, AGPAT8; lysocardiolipin and lysophospholipid acyltransferase
MGTSVLPPACPRNHPATMGMVDIVKGVVFGLCLFASSTIGAAVMLAPSLLIMAVSRSAFHWWSGFVKTKWMHLVGFLLEYVGGVKIIFYGLSPTDHGTLNKPKLVMSNHRTRIDWMLLWMYFARCVPDFWRLHIVLKDELKRLPVFGWGMQYFRFIFLSRKWEKDQEEIKLLCRYYRRYNEYPAVLIFPEATDLHLKAIASSDSFAEKNGLSKFTYVLHPRATGTHFLLNELDDLDCVVDLTMGYKDKVQGVRPSEIGLFKGHFPKEVHVLTERVSLKEIPTDKDEFAKWLDDRFARKDALLREFYENGSAGFKGMQKVEEVSGNYAPVVLLWAVLASLTAAFLSTWTGLVFLVISAVVNGRAAGSLDRFVYREVIREEEKAKKRD